MLMQITNNNNLNKYFLDYNQLKLIIYKKYLWYQEQHKLMLLHYLGFPIKSYKKHNIILIQQGYPWLIKMFMLQIQFIRSPCQMFILFHKSKILLKILIQKREQEDNQLLVMRWKTILLNYLFLNPLQYQLRIILLNFLLDQPTINELWILYKKVIRIYQFFNLIQVKALMM